MEAPQALELLDFHRFYHNFLSIQYLRESLKSETSYGSSKLSLGERLGVRIVAKRLDICADDMFVRLNLKK